MSSYKLLAISGSLRSESYNSKLLKAFSLCAQSGTEIELVTISDIPLFNEDDEVRFPAQVSALKKKIEQADGILIATPEYNRGIPGVLKNTIDYTSRPWGKNSWKGKPVFVASVSLGAIAGALAHYELKKVLIYLDAHVLGQPEFFMGGAAGKFDENGSLTDDSTKEYITSALTVFQNHIDTFRNH